LPPAPKSIGDGMCSPTSSEVVAAAVPAASSAAASGSTEHLLSACGVDFAWTRGELIGRGGFGVVCVLLRLFYRTELCPCVRLIFFLQLLGFRRHQRCNHCC
jgi:hypothetical protein